MNYQDYEDFWDLGENGEYPQQQQSYQTYQPYQSLLGASPNSSQKQFTRLQSYNNYNSFHDGTYDFDNDSVCGVADNHNDNRDENIDEDYSAYMFGNYEKTQKQVSFQNQSLSSSLNQHQEISNTSDKDVLTSWEINKEIKEKILKIDDLFEPYLPQELAEYTWLEVLEIESLSLESLVNLPPNLKKLSAFNNKIKIIANLPDSLEELNLARNFIEEIITLPKNLRILDMSQNKLGLNQNFVNFYFPNSLVELYLPNNTIRILPDLSNLNCLEVLDISNNFIENYDMYPSNLLELEASSNKLNSLKNLPKTLIKLHAFQNQIKMVPNLELMTPNLEDLDLSFNEICFVCMLPDSIISADFSSNKISLIGLKNINEDSTVKLDYKDGKLPTNLKWMDLRTNPLKGISKVFLLDSRIKFSVPPEIILASREQEEKANYTENKINTSTNIISEKEEPKFMQNKYSSSNPYFIIPRKKIKV